MAWIAGLIIWWIGIYAAHKSEIADDMTKKIDMAICSIYLGMGACTIVILGAIYS